MMLHIFRVCALFAVATCWLPTAYAQLQNEKSELRTKRDIIVGADDSLQAEWDRLGLLEKSISYLKRAIPLRSWMTLCSATQVDDTPFSLGECMEAQFRNLYWKPPKQFESDLHSALSKLWAKSPVDALTFSNAMKGQSSSDVVLANVWPILHAGFFMWMIGRLTRLLRLKPANIRLKRVLTVMVILYFYVAILVQVVSYGQFAPALLNLQTVNSLILGVPSVVLGLFLLFHWIRTSTFQKPALMWPKRSKLPRSRWEALLKYDTEISMAADQLHGYGPKWVEKLGEEFFALNEDRRYLPNIVDRLKHDAIQSKK